jgi:hypothetical protein
MRGLIAALFAAIASSLAQEVSASKQLEERFLAIVADQVTSMMREVTTQAPTPGEVSRVMESAIREIQTSYGSLLTLPEADANQLLTAGPDDEANRAAMQRDIELWKRVQRPIPILLKRMQFDFVNGKLNGGLELELARRISELHLQQVGELNR